MSEEHSHHVVPTKLYVFVFLSLIVLTGVTVGAAQIHLGTLGNIILGLIIACVKATLVILFFMNLRNDAKDISIKYFAIFPIILFFIAVAGNLPDIGFRLGDNKPAEPENRMERLPWPEGHSPDDPH